MYQAQGHCTPVPRPRAYSWPLRRREEIPSDSFLIGSRDHRANEFRVLNSVPSNANEGREFANALAVTTKNDDVDSLESEFRGGGGFFDDSDEEEEEEDPWDESEQEDQRLKSLSFNDVPCSDRTYIACSWPTKEVEGTRPAS